MGRLQAIESALISISQSAFQELCDSFLILRNPNYSAFSRSGSQSGKQKTIKGTPDTFLLLPDGRYVFVEYSTNISSGLNKLKSDVLKCIDTSKTGIPVNQIAELILCINFNLKTSEVQSLKTLLANTRILLTLYTLDSLAIELKLNHRDLVNEYLGLPIDTGQIVSIQKFIEEYNRASGGISTPLNNTFLHRELELKEFKKAVLNNDFIILTGSPGIGKTKFALEGINEFLSENLTFVAYCVSYKNHTLLEDLYQYFDSDKDYVLFVDDANRIDAFSQIIGFYGTYRKGRLKIVITIRDYAYQEIGILCQQFSPKRIELSKFVDDQIIDIIKAKPFEIINSDYHKEITRIADGNPRIAIMTALLAKAKQNIYALSDVSDLFENYFSTFVKDVGDITTTLNMQSLGLISFFYTIPYKNREITEAILENFGINYFSFIDAIDRLDKLELVEVQFEHVKIPEQNLSTYFFYKAFIQDGVLSFETLLSKYFDSNYNRFKDCVIPANNTFGPSKVMDKLLPALQKHWKIIKTEETRAFKFLFTFWFYLSGEAIEFIYNLIKSLPVVPIENLKVDRGQNDFSHKKNDVIELLSEFFTHSMNLYEAIELAFDFSRKKPEFLPELIHKIREELTFDRDDEIEGFNRQTILFKFLIDGLNKKDSILAISFYELSKLFLSFRFHHTKGGRNHSFYMYQYRIPNIFEIQEFRKNIWDALEANFESFPESSFKLLESYAAVSPDVSKEIMKFDIQFIVSIIESHLTPISFEHCRYVQDQIRWCKKNSVSHPSFATLKRKFTNPTYQIFLKIDWDRLRDKDVYEFDDYEKYEKLKEEEIRKSFQFDTPNEIDRFYETFTYLKSVSKNEWNYIKTLDYIIDENCEKNFEIGCLLLEKIIEKNNKTNYVPRILFQNHLNSKLKVKVLWELIQSRDFNQKSFWELSFYDHLDDSLINKNFADALANTISRIKEGSGIHFNRLERFLKIEPNIFQILLAIIVDRNENEDIKLQLWMDFFSDYFNHLGNDINLIKKAYLQQDRIQNHFDFNGIGFLNILKKDPTFIFEYVYNLYSVKQFGVSSDHKNLGFIWQVNNIETSLGKAFDLVAEKEPFFSSSDNFCNALFRDLKDSERERAGAFLIDYCKKNFEDSDRMNLLINIVRHSMKELFNEILLLFLSLSQDKELFSKILWRGSGGLYSGNVIIGDIHAAEWRSILTTIENSIQGANLSPIKNYINEEIAYSLKSGDLERQQRFLSRG